MLTLNVLLILPCQQILLLGRHKVRAVDGEEWLSLAHILIGGIGKDLADVAGEAHLHVGEKTLIDIHRAGSAYVVAQLLVLDCAHSYADALHPFGRELDGNERSFHLRCRHGGRWLVRNSRRTRGYRLHIP